MFYVNEQYLSLIYIVLKNKEKIILKIKDVELPFKSFWIIICIYCLLSCLHLVWCTENGLGFIQRT